MYLLPLIFIPLFGSLCSGFLGKFIGQRGSVLISINSVLICFIFSLINAYNNFFLEKNYYIVLMPWINSGLFNCNWGFMFDTLTSIMLVVVTSISTLVHIYSSEYMNGDPHLSRFMSYLNLFTFFMIILVTADNFIQMFVGWEGVGFCSYLLINFWYTRLQANKAAIKAMLINRISDFALVLGLLTIFHFSKSMDYASVFSIIPYSEQFVFSFLNIDVSVLDTICLLLLIGAMGKSAQIFLHTWLPDAMEGPTPVSALIHAATMVTAGVFLIARCSPLFEHSPFVLTITTIVGALTAFFAGTVGLFQNDLKKVIAYSTCSQLGYMMFACGLSSYSLGIFHLYNHAFFKALLFLSAGSVIHAMSDEQDMRKMGGLKRILPFTYMMFVIGSLSLMGFPFLTGFYSKDAILEVAYANHNNIGHFAFWLGTFAAICTSFYSVKLIFLTFLSETNAFKNVIKNAHESVFKMWFPLFCLAFGSIFIGYLSKDMFIGLGTDFWGNSIFIKPNNIKNIDAEFLPVIIKMLPFIVSMISASSAIFLYKYNVNLGFALKTSKYGVYLYNFFNRKWFFDKIYHELISQNILKIGYFDTYKLIDRGFIEMVGPFGLSNYVNDLSRKLQTLQTGYIYNYALLMVICITFFSFIFVYSLNINILSLYIYCFCLFIFLFFI